MGESHEVRCNRKPNPNPNIKGGQGPMGESHKVRCNRKPNPNPNIKGGYVAGGA